MDQTFWDNRYGQRDYVYGVLPNTFLESAVVSHFPESGRVLCLAEGEGRNAVFLATRGYEVSAVDLSSAGKAKAERLAAERGVVIDYVVSDLNDFDFGERKWDAIVSIFAHVDPDSRKAMFQKVLRSLKRDGLFVMEAYHPNQLQYGTGGPKEADKLVTLDDLLPHFDKQQIIHSAEKERDVSEGSFHTGRGYVTQFICRSISA